VKVAQLAQYRKAIAALIGTVLTWLGTAYVPDSHISTLEWYTLALALATVAGVYGVKNESPKV
jgi:hypothetical protein